MTVLHVFHYPTHSAVWALTWTSSPIAEHPEPTRDDGFLRREYAVFPNRAAAEAHVGDLVESQHGVPDFGPLTVTRHATAQPPAPGAIAVRIEGDDDDGKLPMVGWMLYDREGERIKFVDDELYHATVAFERAGVTVVTREPIKVTVSEFMNFDPPF